MIFDEILERAVIGAQRISKLPPERLRVMAEAAFSQVNKDLAKAYAGNEDNRPLLRTDVPLVFVGGAIGIPATALRSYLKDATLVLSTGETASYIEPYADFLRTQDGRLAWWSFSNLLISAKRSAANGGGAYAGAATLTCFASPDVPATAAAAFVAPDEYVSDLIDTLIKYLESRE